MTKLKGLDKAIAQMESGQGKVIEDLDAWIARMDEEAEKMPPIPDPLPAQGFQISPKIAAGQWPIYGGYGVKHGLLKPYASILETDEYGFRRRIFRSLQYRLSFEVRIIRVFQETFPMATPDDVKAFRNYLRAYIAGWDYMYLFRLNQAFIELKQIFDLPLMPTENAIWRWLLRTTVKKRKLPRSAWRRTPSNWIGRARPSLHSCKRARQPYWWRKS